MLNDCALGDLGYSDQPFTWCNNLKGDHRILEWLDHFLANLQWQTLYPNDGVVHGYAAYLDHCPVQLDAHLITCIRRGPQSFRFEAMCVGVEL